MQTRDASRLILLVALALVHVAGCARANGAGIQGVRGRIILWHAWPEAEAQVLDDLLDGFSSAYPQARIIRSAVPSEDLIDEYRTRASMGLGPDLLIAPGHRIRPLAEEGLIRPVGDEEVSEAFFVPALDALRHDGLLYGLPLSLQTAALYHNRDLAGSPPSTLDELLSEAAAGRGVALTADSYHGFWGIQAFGGRALDDEGRVVLDQGGFANWLGWLKLAQGKAGVYVASDHDAARALFAEGRVAYYVGSCSELGALREALGDGALGVSPLPAGPYGAAGPLLEVEALLLNAHSSPEQAELATRLARYLTGAEQQMRLARLAGRVPANGRARIDARLLPLVAGFAAQARTAVPRLNVPQMDHLLAEGDRTYALALEGLLTVSEAASALTAEVNAAHGLDTETEASGTACELEGTLTLGHTWSGEDAAALRRVVQAFTRACPGVYIALRELSPDGGLAAYIEQAEAGGGHDLVVAPGEWIAPLASLGLLREPSELLPGPLAQRFRPIADRALTYEGRAYGLPLSLGAPALYYDPERVTTPAATLEELLRAVEEGQGLVLRADARGAAWALAPTGGLMADSDGRAVLDAEGLDAWLEFLTRASQTPNVTLAADDAELREAFTSGRAAYLIGDASHLAPLRAALGADRVRVAPLPSGPAGRARPLLKVDALLFGPGSGGSRAALAAALAEHATDVPAQRLLAEATGRVPANVNVSLDELPGLTAFAAQAEEAVLPRPYPTGEWPWPAGDALVAAALAGEETGDLAAAFAEAFGPAPAPVEAP